MGRRCHDSQAADVVSSEGLKLIGRNGGVNSARTAEASGLDSPRFRGWKDVWGPSIDRRRLLSETDLLRFG